MEKRFHDNEDLNTNAKVDPLTAGHGDYEQTYTKTEVPTIIHGNTVSTNSIDNLMSNHRLVVKDFFIKTDTPLQYIAGFHFTK